MNKTNYLPDPENTFVVSAEIYRDGGTILVELEDSTKRRFDCFFDGILRLTPCHLYVNAKNTDDLNARLVPFNDADQQIILTVLQRHLDQNLTTEEQRSFNENKESPPRAAEYFNVSVTFPVKGQCAVAGSCASHLEHFVFLGTQQAAGYLPEDRIKEGQTAFSAKRIAAFISSGFLSIDWWN